MRLEAIRAAIAEAGRELERAGLVQGTSGNLSARDPGGGTVAITPSAVPYRRIHPADVPLVGPGGVEEGPHRPSSELAMHLAVYRARPDVAAVVHTHSPWATAWAVLGREIPAVHYVIAPLGNSIRVAPYATYGTVELAEGAVRTLGPDNAVLLAGHGVLVAGADLDAAVEHAMQVEFLAEIYWRAVQVGEPAILPPRELERVRAQTIAKRSAAPVAELPP
ncbi:MAG TPA: class II aldolase/adducin family protein [Actinomycetota bacterium]|nr:class II aldolase/adducin family protein [Actinomycetota bacterium]